MPEIKAGFASAIEAHARDVQVAQADAIRKASLEFQTQAYDRAAAYENVIVVGGYAAFFALWSAVSSDLPRAAALWTVGLMTLSLISYLTFHIAQMVARSFAMLSKVKVMVKAKTLPEVHAALEAIAKPSPSMNAVLFLWPVLLTVCLVTGLPAAALVGFNAIVLALGGSGWPQ